MKKNDLPGRKKPYIFTEDEDDFYGTNIGSFTDCTGLMYKPPEDDAEYASYREVYDFLPPQLADGREHKK